MAEHTSKRNYREEYERWGSKSAAKKRRAIVNRARRKAIKKHGRAALRGKDVSHNSPLSLAKNPNKVGWRLQSAHKNRGQSNRATH